MKTGALQGRNHRAHKTDFSKTEIAQGRKAALINEDKSLREAGQKSGLGTADELAGGNPSSTRQLSRVEQQKYQHSQLIKTEDKML